MDAETNNYVGQQVLISGSEKRFPKPILLVDMDGVVFDYYSGFTKVWTQRYPDRKVVPREELTEFYIESFYPKEYKKDILAITQGTDFFENLQLIPGAKEALYAIQEEGIFDVFLCSAPDVDCVDQVCHSEKARSVELNLGKPWVKKMILTNDKTLVHGAYLVDDKPLIKGIVKNPAWKQIIFDWPYNREAQGIRLNGWAHWNTLKETL